jgi:cyclic-di-AMP phosphodiesterase PgpH
MRRYQLPPGLFPSPSEKNVSGNQFLKIFFVALVCSLVAMLLLPNQGAFPYKYAIGNPWNFKNLVAPFDFEVLRPMSAVKEKLTEIEENHAPYYLLKADIGREQKRKFARLLEERIRVSRNDVQYAELVSNSGAYLGFGQELLDKMYKIGINSSEDQLANDDPSAKIWLVTANNSDILISIQDVLTPELAANFLSDSLPYSNLRQPEFILPLLEQSIAPNIIYSDSLTLISKRKKIAAVVSTGITVRKGEKIIYRGELVENETLQKLDSLSQRYEQQISWQKMLGYTLVFFGLFFGLFIWIFARIPDFFEEKKEVLLLLIVLLGTLAAIKFGNRVGLGIPFLLPIGGIPLFLRKIWGSSIALATWFCILIVSGFGLDWGISWLLLQTIVGLGLYLLLPIGKTNKVQIASVCLISLITVLFWLAMSLSGRLPESVQANEVPIFIAIAAFLGSTAERFSRLFYDRRKYNQ